MPEEVQGSDPALSPEFDPGGDSTDLPFDAPPVPQTPAPPDPSSDDAAPLEEEPQTDAEVPVADPGDEPTEVDGQEAPAPPADTPTATPAPTEAPPPVTSVPPATPPAEAPVSAPRPQGDDVSESRPVRTAPRERRGSRRANEQGATRVVSIVSNEAPSSPAVPSTDVQPQAEAVPVVNALVPRRQRPVLDTAT